MFLSNCEVFECISVAGGRHDAFLVHFLDDSKIHVLLNDDQVFLGPADNNAHLRQQTNIVPRR